MSGQVVTSPKEIPLVVIGVATLGVGIAVAAGAVKVARAVQSLVDQRVAVAMQEVEAEKARLQEWRTFLAKQKEEMDKVAELQAALRQAENELQVVQLVSLEFIRNEKPQGGSTSEGYLSLGKKKATGEEARPLLMELSDIMAALPSSFKEDTASPYRRLARQQERLAAALESPKPPALEELAAFKETISRTLSGYLEMQESHAKTRENLCQELDLLIGELLLCRRLAEEPKVVQSLDAIQHQVMALAHLEYVKPGHLDLLKKHFAEVKNQLERQESQRAYRLAITESLTRNLTDMGYESVQGFAYPEAPGACQALFALPGGEVVRVALRGDQRLAFEMAHWDKKGAGLLTPEDLAFFKKQEEKWCLDLLELLRRLAQEGFPQEIKLERQVPSESISIAVVETVEDILAAEGEEEEEFPFPAEVKQRTIE